VVGTILEKIVETKRREVAAAKSSRPTETLRHDAEIAASARDFYSAVTPLNKTPEAPIRLIAEIKKASPSAGLIRADFDPVALAEAYESGGASALSVLTDRTYFQGDLSLIELVKQAVRMPVLRKDFIIDSYQIYESRVAGADAILLIAAILPAKQLDEWSQIAFELGMSTLIEVHDEKELKGVLPIIDPERRTILGINNRDLKAQTTDIDSTRRLATQLPPATPFVTESGIASREDVQLLHSYGATAMLVGETLMLASDVEAKTRELLGA
jgi:indole-3-glycerol phosphate synthase